MKVFKIIRLDNVDSTNNYLKELAKNGCNENTVVIAKSQSNGKGTKGRSFVSDEGGVYMSILISPKKSDFDATLVTSMTAVAVCKTIEQISKRNVDIKWVNDLYIDNKKVCGILCESVVIGSSIPFVIVGIGINLVRPKNFFPKEIADIATYIFEKEDPCVREKFETRLLENFSEYYKNIESKTFLPFYRQKNMVLGKEVTVISGTETQNAKALEIDDSCRLLVEFSDKTKKYISSAEVQIKLS